MTAALMISPLELTLLDWIVLAILVYSVIDSFMKGFARELMGLATIVVALLLSGWFYRNASALFKDVVKTENLALFFGFSSVFLGTLLVGWLVTWLIVRFVKFAKLQWIDRGLGGAFGFIRGWVLGSIVFLGLTAFNVQADRVRKSELAPYFLPGSRIIVMVTPYEMKARFLVGYRAVEQWWHAQS